MKTAFEIIRKELGKDAVILSTRKVKTPDGQPSLNITAAVDKSYDDAKVEVEPAISQDDKAPKPQGLEGFLNKHGVAPDVVDKISKAVTALKDTGFDEKDTLDMVLGKMVPFVAPAKAMPKGMAHVFVGPTGAGKTTTISKLAVERKKAGDSVGLITLDNQRIGGYEQLNIVADALQESARMIKTPEELAQALDELGDRDYVFIDTPGINPFDKNSLLKLREKIKDVSLPTRVHLVLPTTMNTMEMPSIPIAFEVHKPESIIFTKLDETSYLGGMANVAMLSGLDVCFVTDGTNITSDITHLDAPSLAQRLTQAPRYPWEVK